MQTHADAGSNMETYYKQVGSYFYWNTHGTLYSWQLPETYMQSAPAALRLKHARWIMLKTKKKKKKNTHPLSLQSDNWEWSKFFIPIISIPNIFLATKLKTQLQIVA